MWEKEMSVAPMTFQNRAFKVVALTYNGIDSLREWKLSKQESFVTKVIDLLTKRGDKYYLQMVMLTKRTCKLGLKPYFFEDASMDPMSICVL